jgi:tripartite ATP-independent transporter DctM subunit
MDWPLLLALIFGGLLVLMFSGMPVALGFMLINVIGALLFLGGTRGIEQLTFSFQSSLTRFSLIALPLFILMGEIMFHSGIAPKMMDALDLWLGRLPGRLGLIAVASGTIFATLTGSSSGSVAMLGSTLVPEMYKRGYSKEMSLGPILGSGGLAIMIPPSGLAVLLGAIGEISIAAILIGIIMPGLLMAAMYATYIILRSMLQPSLAPVYDVPPRPFSRKLLETTKYIFPLSFVVFMVVGVIFIGVATPSEAAALGVVSCYILSACYKRLDWKVVKTSTTGAIQITVMIFTIIVGAQAFSEILAFSGATSGLVKLALSFPVPPIYIFIFMQVVVLILGCLMDSASILMLTLPLFMPIVRGLGFNEVWFAVVMMVNIEIGLLTPPFGMSLFVLKGIAPEGTTMNDVVRSALPFVGMELLAMALVVVFPPIATWLPGLMR